MPYYVPIAIVVVCMIWTLTRIPAENALGDGIAEKAKVREFMVLDIRANSQYCSWYVGLIGVILAIVAAHKDDFAKSLTALDMWPFAIALFAATIATVFLPAGYGPSNFKFLRPVWVRSVVCEQIVVIFTCYGIWRAFLVVVLM